MGKGKKKVAISKKEEEQAQKVINISGLQAKNLKRII